MIGNSFQKYFQQAILDLNLSPDEEFIQLSNHAFVVIRQGDFSKFCLSIAPWKMYLWYTCIYPHLTCYLVIYLRSRSMMEIPPAKEIWALHFSKVACGL